MSFFRKVASAFVVMDEGAVRKDESAPSEPPAGLDDMTKETSTLLAQLESSERADDAPAAAPLAPGAPTAEAEAPLTALTAEDVFRREGLGDGPNSALRLLKLVAGLQMFPREQQLAMVRAMDAADDTWSEPEVITDAQHRQDALRAHLAELAAERRARSEAIAAEMEQTRRGGEAVLAEIDRRIAELSQRRQHETEATARALAALSQREQALAEQELRARQGVAQVIQALGGLLTFLGATHGPEERR